MLIITKDNFEQEVLTSDVPVLVDFWATWCGPCMMLAPTVEAFAKEHPEIKVGKVDVDKEPELASAYGIMSIPSLLLFKNGKVVKQSVGAVAKSKLELLLK